MTVSTAVPSHHEVPMTREGYEHLRDELATLTTTARAEITDRLRAAREDGGELSDNLELIDALEDQDLLERRITAWRQRSPRHGSCMNRHATARSGSARASNSETSIAGESRSTRSWAPSRPIPLTEGPQRTRLWDESCSAGEPETSSRWRRRVAGCASGSSRYIRMATRTVSRPSPGRIGVATGAGLRTSRRGELTCVLAELLERSRSRTSAPTSSTHSAKCRSC